MEMTSEYVKLDIEGGVAKVTLNRPDKRNAINGEMLESLSKIFKGLVAEKEAKVVLLMGEGQMFSSGIDLNFIATLAQGDESVRGARMRDVIRGIQDVMHQMERLEKPIIALMHGVAAGLGLELALAADFRIATESCRIGLPEVILGLIPDCGGTTRLTRIVGPAHARELILIGDFVTASRALEMGMLNRVTADDALETTGREWIDKLLDRPAMTVGLAKRAIQLGVDVDAATHMEMEALIQCLLIGHKDFASILMQGIAKMKSKKN